MKYLFLLSNISLIKKKYNEKYIELICKWYNSDSTVKLMLMSLYNGDSTVTLMLMSLYESDSTI